MNKNYKGSPTFVEIDDVRLRTWNRCAIIFNLLADRGQEAAKAYAKQFPKDEVSQIYGMFDCIKKFGYENVRKQVQLKEVV